VVVLASIRQFRTKRPCCVPWVGCLPLCMPCVCVWVCSDRQTFPICACPSMLCIRKRFFLLFMSGCVVVHHTMHFAINTSTPYAMHTIGRPVSQSIAVHPTHCAIITSIHPSHRSISHTHTHPSIHLHYTRAAPHVRVRQTTSRGKDVKTSPSFAHHPGSALAARG